MSHDISKYVQNSYQRILDDGLPGTPADANPKFRDSFVCEEADGIGYGLVISRGSIAPQNGNTQTGRLGTSGALAATAGSLSGTGPVADLVDLQAITDGEFDITVDGALVQARTLDFSGAATYAAVAAIIETEITAAIALVTYNADGHFVITSATTGVGSTVTVASAPGAPGTGVPVQELLGLDSGEVVDGQDLTTLVILGITERVLISESRSVSESSEVVTKENEIGAVVNDGRIKVLANEATVDNGDVYFSDTTGEIFSAAGAGRTQLGSAKFRGSVAAGKIAIVDVAGLR